jgi:hypothetical protein
MVGLRLVPTLVLGTLALATLGPLSPIAEAAPGPGHYAVTWSMKLYPPGSGFTWDIPAGLDCRLPVVADPSTHFRLRCVPTFVAASCKNPQVQGYFEAIDWGMTFQSTCNDQTVTQCTTNTPELNAAKWWDVPINSAKCSASKLGTKAALLWCDGRFTDVQAEPTRWKMVCEADFL